MKKKFSIIVFVIALLAVAGAISFVIRQQKIASIDSFEECEASGYEILKSFPPQCRTPDGRIFGQRVQTGTEVAFTELKKGAFNAIEREQQRVIRATEEWADLWNEMFPTEMITPVPFEDKMILAVFMGSVGSAGRGVQIIKILEKENLLEVYVQEELPGRGCVSAAVITQPYHIIQLRRIDKEVKFIFEEKVRDC